MDDNSPSPLFQIVAFDFLMRDNEKAEREIAANRYR